MGFESGKGIGVCGKLYLCMPIRPVLVSRATKVVEVSSSVAICRAPSKVKLQSRFRLIRHYNKSLLGGQTSRVNRSTFCRVASFCQDS